MLRYTLNRVLLMIPTLIGVAVLVFFMLRVIPGDVVEVKLRGDGGNVSQETIEMERHRLGLDKIYDDHLRERDPEKRKAMIRAFEKRAFENAYQEPILWWHRIVPTHKTVMGWKMSPSHNLGAQLEEVWLNA